MKRKLKIPAARNPFVALALKRKAGAHRKTGKAIRRAEKVDIQRGCNSVGQSTWLLTRESFGSNPTALTRALPQATNASENVFFPDGGIGRRAGFRNQYLRVCRFEADLGHQ